VPVSASLLEIIAVADDRKVGAKITVSTLPSSI